MVDSGNSDWEGKAILKHPPSRSKHNNYGINISKVSNQYTLQKLVHISTDKQGTVIIPEGVPSGVDF